MRIVSLYWTLVRAGLRSQLQYRTNCIILVVTGLAWQCTGFISIWIILNQFHHLVGWGLGEIAFLYGIRLLIHALSSISFGLLQRIPNLVRWGEFDMFLIRPLPSLLQVMTFRFPLSQFGDLLGGLLLFTAASMHVKIDWSPLTVIYLLAALVGGSLVEAAIILLVSSLSFRLISIYPLVFLLDDILNMASNYPLTIYKGWLNFLFTFVLPIAFLAYFPATILLGHTGELNVSPIFAYLSPLIGGFLFTIAYLFYKRELCFYQSTGH